MSAKGVMSAMRRCLLMLILLGLAGITSLAGCASYNTVERGADSALMLKGNDPVSYFTQTMPAKGDPAIKAEFEGVTYRFANEADKAEFLRTPRRYVPQYAGFCANGAVYGLLLGGDADIYKIVDKRLFIFSNAESRAFWEMEQLKNLELGDRYWETEMKGTPWRYQTAKRLVFKVPHYKTHKELTEELARRRSGDVATPPSHSAP